MRKLALLVMLLSTPVQAHRAWEDGGPVEPWIQASCCGISDMHWFTVDQVHQDEKCWYVDPPFPANGGCIPRDPPECAGFDENGSSFIAHNCKEHVNQHGGLYWFFWTDNPKNGPEFKGTPTIYCIFYPASF